MRPQCLRINICLFYVRLFPHYARTEKFLKLCQHIRLRPTSDSSVDSSLGLGLGLRLVRRVRARVRVRGLGYGADKSADANWIT